ncbi:GH36-type glycosyl hydrolase domain-containing protein [Guptibacillus algicola]|uniref:GH36-type glycosyl hydrolase domain-containing protein n=1 Tax=Guptibacillus algicola TaxID=225844 RepID=UPI001CD81008|nr:cellobiose phosphorylase [Alkalihalobacillus algicola]MCA0986947.1 cellobiose phosphorylase [Alkalihalobacillus algicola]
MLKTTEEHKTHLRAGEVEAVFLNSGDLYELSSNTIMINQVLSNPIDGALNNLYLRVFLEKEIQSYPLIGVKSNSDVCFEESRVIWTGEVSGVKYRVTFMLSERNIWFWDVAVEGSDVEVDVIYGQDLGLAEKGAVRTNEAYMSQYMDHAVFDTHNGYVVCTRQNQPQQGSFPYLQQGSLGNIAGYSTDGFQFFGLSYKETNEPEVLKRESLANEIYQYEFGYTALQTERVQLDGIERFAFYGLFKGNHQEAVAQREYEEEIKSAWDDVQKRAEKEGEPGQKVNLQTGRPLQTISMTEGDVSELFPNRVQEEREDNQLLSFFTNTYEHVVLKEKELLVERPHGHILMSGENDRLNENVISTTSYMYGLFNSQLSLGNTSFHKMLSNARNPLNIMKTSGQRIYIELNGEFMLLSMPSMFEMGFNYARWYYKMEDDMLIVTNFTTVDSQQVQLDVCSKNGKEYRFLVTNQITMNNLEYESTYLVIHDEGRLTYKAGEEGPSKKSTPDLSYHLQLFGGSMKVGDEQLLGENIPSGSASLTVMDVSPSDKWSIVIQGARYGECTISEKNAEVEIERYRAFYNGVMNGFEVATMRESSDDLEKVNALAWWYTHNMLVHFSVPRGLEQYIGAAWGTRDVCQGPTEYFLATQNYKTVRKIIQTVYAHQYEDEGNWPQWFMFDEYASVQQDESHGDVIVWPLKVIGDYIAATGDHDILNEQIPFTKRGDFSFTDHQYTLREHIEKQLHYIKNNFLHNTHLSSYGDGDWDDTLQPANAQLKKYMVSSWTVALTYQAMVKLSEAVGSSNEASLSRDLQELAKGIERDYQEFILNSNVIPGFLYMEDKNNPEKMLHPEDSKTGISYRLLPMIRGMISELLSAEEVETHYELIKEHLYCPDGVRLMNRPAHYIGGVSTHFKRAEQASNFGREIGLQYVHAHIRFVEAMAKLGKADEVWQGLQMINPIGITDVVMNAEKRQSNAYFSSSDGKFKTRYEAQEHFEELKKGTVPVKGGWRIYSSGPGIYMNQLITNTLGVREEAGKMVIDPVLPQKLDGLQFQFRFWNKPITFVYHLNKGENRVIVNGTVVETETTKNRYRSGGELLERDLVEKLLKDDGNLIEIWR